jgi:hypothetical protein
MSKTDFEDAHATAIEALETARKLPPGPERSDAFKEAGRLRAAADRLRPIRFAPRGRRRKDSGLKGD